MQCKLGSYIGLILFGPLQFPYTCPLLPPACAALPLVCPCSIYSWSIPWDHPHPPLSAVQSLLTELSPDGKGERKRLSAALGQPESNSSPTAGWLTGLYRLIPNVAGWDDALHRQTGSVSPLGEGAVSRDSGSWGLRFEWPQRALDWGVEREGVVLRGQNKHCFTGCVEPIEARAPVFTDQKQCLCVYSTISAILLSLTRVWAQ